MGSLDRCSSAGISGWAVENGRPAVVRILAGSNVLTTLSCDVSRPDLEAAGLPPNAGFLFKTSPQSGLPTNAGIVSVQFTNGVELANSPKPFSRHDGNLDHGDERGLAGWAIWDGEPAELEIFVGEKLVGTARSDLKRDDIETTLQLGSGSGFAHAFPGLVSDAIVSVRFQDGTLLGQYKTPSSEELLLREYRNKLAEYRAQIEPSLIDADRALRDSGDFPSEPAVAALLRARREILEGGLFDPEFYLRDNPDVRSSGMDPLDHYLRHGEPEGRRPNEVFRPSEYAHVNRLRLGDKASALAHYSSCGERSGFRPSLAFNPQAYLDANPLLRDNIGRPLFHYLKIGRAANLPLKRLAAPAPRRRKRRIVAQLAVKNEAELIERTISHLRRIGVDHIVACDIASTDGTREILERHRSSDFWLEYLTDGFNTANPSPSELASFRRYKEIDADWVLFLDADEFWIPASGNLKDCEAIDIVDVLSVPRYNVVPGLTGPKMPDQIDPARYDELLVIARPLAEIHKWLTENPATPWIMGWDAPKLMARTSLLAGTTIGEHEAVVEAGATVRRGRASDLFIAHLPLSSRDRFQRKVESIVSLSNVLGISDPEDRWKKGGVSWHWWRWTTLNGEREIDREFDRNTFSAIQIEELRQKGVVCSASELLAEHLIEPARIFCAAGM